MAKEDIKRAYDDGFFIKLGVDSRFTVVGPEKQYWTYSTREEAIENLVADHECWLEAVAMREQIESDTELKAFMEEACSGKKPFRVRKWKPA